MVKVRFWVPCAVLEAGVRVCSCMAAWEGGRVLDPEFLEQRERVVCRSGECESDEVIRLYVCMQVLLFLRVCFVLACNVFLLSLSSSSS